MNKTTVSLAAIALTCLGVNIFSNTLAQSVNFTANFVQTRYKYGKMKKT